MAANKITAPNGVTYPSEKAMCEAYGISRDLYKSRKKRNKTLEECLAAPGIRGGANLRSCADCKWAYHIPKIHLSEGIYQHECIFCAHEQEEIPDAWHKDYVYKRPYWESREKWELHQDECMYLIYTYLVQEYEEIWGNHPSWEDIDELLRFFLECNEDKTPLYIQPSTCEACVYFEYWLDPYTGDCYNLCVDRCDKKHNRYIPCDHVGYILNKSWNQDISYEVAVYFYHEPGWFVCDHCGYPQSNDRRAMEYNDDHTGVCKYCNNQRLKVWSRENHEEQKMSMRRAVHKRRMVEKHLAATLTKQDWQDTLSYFENKCAYCGARDNLEQDHIIPVSRGGAYTKENIIPACSSCNPSKSNKEWTKWYRRQSFYDASKEEKIRRFILCEKGAAS